MTFPRLNLLLAGFLALIILSSCSSSSGVTAEHRHDFGSPDNNYGLIAVKMRPAPVQDPPFADATLGKVVSSPAQLAALLPPLRTASFTEEDLMRPGGSFDNSLPMNHVMTSGPGDMQATFSPMWSGEGSPLSDAAFALYRFPLQDYGPESGEQTLGFSWGDGMPAPGDLWIGLGNIAKDHWDWFMGEEDGVLTIGKYSPYEAGDGSVFCAIVVLGQQELVLDHMQIGAFELRGTGADIVLFEPPAPQFPNFPLYADTTVDLTPGCAPIGDQGSTWMCTAFATANGALNYEMNALYGPCGWDFAKPFNRASPRFVYNQTGVDFGGSCPVGGRSTVDVAQWLLDNGAATEYNAPIGPVTPSAAFNCTAYWTAPAYADAAAMRPTQYGFWGTKDPGNDKWYLTQSQIDDIKSFLAVVRKPVIFATNLDAWFSFTDYEDGESWTYAGPKDGSHAMLIVGYDNDRNGGSFKVRNSWGKWWGDDGYCWITYASFKNSESSACAMFIKCSYSQAAEDRFCPDPPPLLPPFDITFEPDPGIIQISWPFIPGASRYVIYRDSQDEPLGFVTQKGEEDPVFTDNTVDDYLTHVYWIQAIGDEGTSPMSAPFFCYRQTST